MRGGSDRARTDDLFRVKEALSLLSYVPMRSYYSIDFQKINYFFEKGQDYSLHRNDQEGNCHKQCFPVTYTQDTKIRSGFL